MIVATLAQCSWRTTSVMWDDPAAGMSYELGWDDAVGADDDVTESHGVKVLVDSKSMPYLKGSEIDYVDNQMLGAGFAIRNPNVKSSCGCGSSHQF